MPDARRLTGRDIQVFVAGALTFEGIQSAMAFLYHFASADRVGWIAFVVSVLALPIGLAMLLRSTFAFQLALLYLSLAVLLSCIMLSTAIYISGTRILSQPVPRMIWRPLPIPVILLMLLVWSRSRRVADDDNA